MTRTLRAVCSRHAGSVRPSTKSIDTVFPEKFLFFYTALKKSRFVRFIPTEHELKVFEFLFETYLKVFAKRCIVIVF